MLLFVLLLLCVTVLAQSSALLAQSELHHSRDHCCLLCHVGPLPFLQISVHEARVPSLPMVWLTLAARFGTTSEGPQYSSPSRAPPTV